MPSLRIVSVNDVYSLENLPRLRGLVDHYRAQKDCDALLVVLAGDFLAPSLLSSMDAGRGMVDCLNAVGVTHVILGNHEDDLPPGELRHRLKELRPVCIGTNVLSGLDLPRHDIIAVGPLKVGLVGVVMADPSVYRGAPFGDVELARANDAAIAEAASLVAAGAVGVVAITHQAIADDRALAVAQRTPPLLAIIGGHDHTPMLVDVEGTWIVKAGSEAVHVAVTDVVWASAGAAPVVTTRLEDVAGYPEDASLRARVDKHMAAVRELSAATLLYLEPNAALSSKGTRSRQTSMGALICSRLRDCLGAEACLFNGGGIRASRDYTERFTYGDVETEVPFDNAIVVVPLPGVVIRDAVAASRAKAPVESGAFLQVDDRMTVSDGPEHTVLAIDGAPLELEREYHVAIVRQLLFGLDRVEPLVRWAEANPSLVPPADSGREPKMVLVQSFALGIWRDLGGFDAVDADGDDQVTPSEIAAAMAKRHPSQAPSRVLADILVGAIDTDADRIISRADAAALREPGRAPRASPPLGEPPPERTEE
ncbi:MAG: 5'-nucleotidase C-terminal domain-containing protein [Labilithrix sp.]|nr:5'-nucleotidase C-terminal domain-containing protein [Labilithrix sp.]